MKIIDFDHKIVNGKMLNEMMTIFIPGILSAIADNCKCKQGTHTASKGDSYTCSQALPDNCKRKEGTHTSSKGDSYTCSQALPLLISLKSCPK